MARGVLCIKKAPHTVVRGAFLMESSLARALARRPSYCLQTGFQQLGQFREVARDGEAAFFHDGQFGLGRVGTT